MVMDLSEWTSEIGMEIITKIEEKGKIYDRTEGVEEMNRAEPWERFFANFQRESQTNDAHADLKAAPRWTVAWLLLVSPSPGPISTILDEIGHF